MLRRLVVGVSALAIVVFVGGSLTVGALAMVAASVDARAKLQTTGPFASQAIAQNDWPTSPLRAQGYLTVAQIETNSASMPRFKFDVKLSPVPLAASFPMGRLAMATADDPDATGSIPIESGHDHEPQHEHKPAASLIAKVAIAEPVPLPRTRPRLALAIEPKSLLSTPVEPIPARTAIYDISARTVYMPNGDKLEAHSGLGEWMDDPSSIKIKNRGVTPPNIYQLTLRESLFHGVQAIRLNPVNEDKMYGRDGILAHTYMLGPSGQSNGCVSFRDYQQFLQAFRRGEVDRMIVVTNSGREPVRAAARTPVRHAERYRYALNNRKPSDFREDYAAVR